MLSTFANKKVLPARKNKKVISASARPVQNKQLLPINWGIGLPTAVMQHTLFGYHALQEAENFAKASAPTAAVYAKPLLIAKATLLLDHVAKGRLVEAEKFLKANPEIVSRLLSAKVPVTDYSGRKFKSITAFQYALWALDRSMWQMLSKYISSQEAAKQLQELERDGVEYELPAGDQKAEIRNEKHYNFDELTLPYARYIRLNLNLNNHQGATMDQVDQAWLHVGLAQRNVPVHVANEYSCPNQAPQSDKSLVGYPMLAWFPLIPDRGLGFDFSALRGKPTECLAARSIGSCESAGSDLAAIINFRSARNKAYLQLKEHLLNAALVEDRESNLRSAVMPAKAGI